MRYPQPPTPASRNTGLTLIILLLLFAIFHGPIIAFFTNLGQPEVIEINPTPTPFPSFTPTPVPTVKPTPLPTPVATPTPVVYRTDDLPQSGPADGLLIMAVAAIAIGGFVYRQTRS